MRLIAAVALLALAPLAGAAQISKCLDASGKVVGYGADCPAGTRAEATSIRNAPAATEGTSKSMTDREAEFQKRQTERKESEAKAEKSATENLQRKRACADAQGYLKNLQSGQRIRTTDPKTGERGYMADAEYPKEMARAQKAVGEHCK